jgi:hypothetical protein
MSDEYFELFDRSGTERIDTSIEATIAATITCCTWLVRRGHADLAHDMRDEFCREWEVPAQMWNDEVANLVDYVNRKGTTPEISTRQLMEVAIVR